MVLRVTRRAFLDRRAPAGTVSRAAMAAGNGREPGVMSERHEHGREHPLVDLARRQLVERKSDRREFLRTVTLLGVSATAAYAMVGEILGEASVGPVQAQETP